MDIKKIIQEELDKFFAPAPKMGDIEPTPEDDEDRPGMKNRPRDGMDMSQHHKMMHAEGKVGKKAESGPESSGVRMPWLVIPSQVVDSVLVTKGDKRYKNGKVANIDLKKLLATQDDLFLGKSDLLAAGKEKITKKRIPIIIELPNGVRVIQDGHHRLAGQLLNKKKAGTVFLIKLDKWPDAFSQHYFKTGKEKFELFDQPPMEESVTESVLTGFDLFDIEDEEVAPPDPSFEAFSNLKRGNVVKIGKYKFDITNNSDNFTKVANLHGSKGRKYYILRFDPDAKQVSVFQGKGGTLDHDPEPKIVGPMTLEEMAAISGGGAGMASSGKVSATSGGGAWGDNEEQHDLMWSGDSVKEERIGKPNHKGVDYFQMGSSLPDNLYNRKNGKPSRDPGSAKIRKEQSDFKIGDKVLFGKYKNKKGVVSGFGKDEKGNPTVEIQPVSKDGEKTKVKKIMGLYKIWSDKN